MDHPRKLIRKAVVEAIIDQDTAAGPRVFPSRKVSLRKLDLPAICVYTLEEDADDEETAPRELTRNLSLAVELIVSATDDVDDDVDDLCAEVEAALARDPQLGGLVADLVLVRTDVALVAQGEREHGLAILSFDVEYYTLAPDTSAAALDDFNTVGTTHNLGGEQAEDDDLHSEFTVQEPAA